MKFKNIKKKLRVKEKKAKSPNNSRSIPARHARQLAGVAGRPEPLKLSLPKFNSVTLLKIYRRSLKVVVVIIYFLAVVVIGLDLQKNLKTQQNVNFQRKILTKNIKFWEDFLSKNNNYPDAYFQASIANYRVSNMAKAKMYVQKGLFLDPNSKNGKKIKDFLTKQ